LEDSLVPHQDLYARLEGLTPSDLNRSAPAPTVWTLTQRRIIRWSQALVKSFLGSREPQITRKVDLDGHGYYVVFDPVDQRRYTFGSEQEVRIWLDQRYYQ
jgi:hypothetical protein